MYRARSSGLELSADSEPPRLVRQRNYSNQTVRVSCDRRQNIDLTTFKVHALISGHSTDRDTCLIFSYFTIRFKVVLSFLKFAILKFKMLF